MRHVGMLLWGVGCHKLPDVVWGEAPAGPAANVFCFFCAMKRILGHKNANYWRLVAGWAQGQNIGDEGLRAWDYSRLAKSATTCRYGNYSLYSPAHTQWRRGHGRGSVPQIFSNEKNCAKSISHKFWNGLPRVHLGGTCFQWWAKVNLKRVNF